MMNEITVAANAKINLYLEVLSRRPDGYHDLESNMQTVSLGDTVTVTRTGSGISLRCSDPSLPCDKKNLGFRAARLFTALTGIADGWRIDIEKRIPSQAGLGGGSADAAAVLRALEVMYDVRIDRDLLLAESKKIGADVPFCLVGGALRVQGIGEILTPCRTMPDCGLVIVKGGIPVSTPAAYAAMDRSARSVQAGHPMTDLLETGSLDAVCGGLYNAFETVAPCEAEKELLRSHGAIGALLCGSGSAVFGVFRTEAEAASACEAIRQRGRDAFAAKPVPAEA